MRQQERLTGIPDDLAGACLREYNRYLLSSEVRELARPEGRKRKFENRDGFIKPKARSMEQNTSSLSISQNHPGWKRRKGQRVTGKNPVPQQAAPQRKVHATAETGAGRMLGKGRPEGRPDTACGFDAWAWREVAAWLWCALLKIRKSKLKLESGNSKLGAV